MNNYNLRIEKGVPLPVRKVGSGCYQRRRAIKENSPTAIFQRMEIGDSLLFKDAKLGNSFLSHVVRCFGSGHMRSMRLNCGRLRLWKVA